MDATEFMECSACRALPGSPALCESCLHNRTAIERLAKSIPPPNLNFERQYVCSLSHGGASLTITFPGGKLDSQDAIDVRDWLRMIERHIERFIEE